MVGQMVTFQIYHQWFLILNYLYNEFSFFGLPGMLPVNLHVNMWEKIQVLYVVPERLRLDVFIHR